MELTSKELIKILKKFPSDAKIFINDTSDICFVGGYNSDGSWMLRLSEEDKESKSDKSAEKACETPQD